MQKYTSKSYASQNRLFKVESSVMEICESIHCSRHCSLL